MTTTVLIVDDEARIRDVLQYALQREGYQVLSAANGEQALQIVHNERVDLIILDVLMPELDGLSTCRRLREFSSLPVIFLTSRSDEVDRITGLDLGADDYVTKPFSPRELLSRVRAVLRRSKGVNAERKDAHDDEDAAVVRVQDLQINPTRHEARLGDAALMLTATEFAILYALARRPGRLFSREQLIDLAYDDDVHVSDRTVDTHIKRIRAKLRAARLQNQPAHSKPKHGLRGEVQREGADLIETVHGLGYKLNGR